MNTDIAIRSTAKNWIVSIRRTSMHGIVTTVPVATIPRLAQCRPRGGQAPWLGPYQGAGSLP